MTDKTAGLEARYEVRKINDPAGKHDGCRYFVLDPQHDPHARCALAAYERSCRTEYPALAADLRGWLTQIRVAPVLDVMAEIEATDG